MIFQPHAGGMSARGQPKQRDLLEAPSREMVGPWMSSLQFLHPRFGHIADRPPIRCVG